jgi:hypothetical protein
MNSRNYTRPTVPDGWANSRKTDNAIAKAIHAIADAKRSPEAIWENPTPAEYDHIRMAVEEYIAHGDFEAAPGGQYHWGSEQFEIGGA